MKNIIIGLAIGFLLSSAFFIPCVLSGKKNQCHCVHKAEGSIEKPEVRRSPNLPFQPNEPSKDIVNRYEAKKSALSTQVNAHALFEEANAYYRGYGVENDYAKALALFEEAYKAEGADKGRIACFIGNIYAQGGHGVTSDRKLAIKWYNQSVEDGQYGTYCRLVDIYLSCNEPSNRNISKAVEYAIILEEKSNSEDWANLIEVARAYAHAGSFGEAVRVQEKAVAWLEKSDKCSHEMLEKYKWILGLYENGEIVCCRH